MKTSIILLVILNMFVCAHAQTNPYINEDSIIAFDKIPNWILNNIQFPQEAYQYGVAGIEQVCISSSWDGKVFITSPLNPLNPAFEKEIINVISKAPSCRFTGSEPKDIYKYMLIDFYKYIPEDKQSQIKRVTFHTPPRLLNIPTGPFNSREKFIQWIYKSIKIPSVIKCFNDTITIRYTVTKSGKVNNLSILQCKNDTIKEALKRILLKSPRWQPAITDGKKNIDITICDKIILKIDESGKVTKFARFEDNVFCNTKRKPIDPNMIVLNPEIKPIFDNKKNFTKSIIDCIADDKRINLNGSFIIEKDGTVSHINISNSSDLETDSIIVQAIARTKWTAAVQGGIPVRTIYSFGINKRPKKSYKNPTYYDIFGKYFIALQANPSRTSYSFIHQDGTIQNYPFSKQGLFDFKAYHEGMLYYYKNNSFRNGNITKKYFDKLYKLYVTH